MKVKLKTKYDTYHRKEGTYNIGDSLTDKSQYEDSDIKCCLRKYGMSTLLNQTMAKEPLYIDNRYRDLNVADAIRLKEELKTYYEQLPAIVRKQFGDNVDMFYEKFRAGDFNEMIATGILTEEYAKELKNDEEVQRYNINGNNSTTTDNQSNSGNVQNTEESV